MDLNNKRILEILEEKNISLAEVARRLGYSRQYVSEIVSRGSCGFKTVVKIAKALDVSASEIVEGNQAVLENASRMCPVHKGLCATQNCAWWIKPESWIEGACAITCIACNSAFLSNDIEGLTSRISQ